jgi:DNA-binding NtrC family response regulator
VKSRAVKINILILDDEKMWQFTTQKLCTEILNSIFESKAESAKVILKFFIASTIDEASAILVDNQIHLFLLDKDLGVDQGGSKKINGVDYISQFKSLQPLCQIVMLTADISMKDITRAMKNGASEYLLKSNEDDHREHRFEIIRKSLEHYSDQLTKTKQSAPIRKGLYSNYVCKSPAMQRLDNKLLAISESQRPVLLLGQTGLGKGAVARRISELRRKELSQSHREFVQINIAATEKGLAESILFGTEPGAFTDASKQTKPGLLDAAREGDIFLDEIGDASLDLQLKLLKVVEEKEYYRVGGTRPIKTDSSFIFATNKNLQALVAEGKFREDLYMRISVFEETLPLLSERKEDIPSIVQGFLAAACAEAKNKNFEIDDLPEDLMNYFMRDEIPGNIRGIENDVARLVAHIPFDEHGKPQIQNWKKALGQGTQAYSRKAQILNIEQLLNAKTNFLDKDFPGLWALGQILEKRVIEEVNAKGLSIEQAAKLLKVSPNTVWSRKKQFMSELKGKIQ